MIFLMMVVLMSLHHFCKVLSTYLFLFGNQLSFCPLKDFLPLNSVICLFDIFTVLHHFFNIVLHPGLFFIYLAHSHVPKELLFSKAAYFILCNLDPVGGSYPLRNEGPLQLIEENGKLFFNFFIRL